jgi:hypothetical protein
MPTETDNIEIANIQTANIQTANIQTDNIINDLPQPISSSDNIGAEL